jgi:2,4-dienoyl-CoA reductase-like NADH-dependent reductase (Old Yellow Enzyme family)/thioredoxin reductase
MTRDRDFKNLLSPIKIGNVELKNRIVMAPMSAPAFAAFDGSPTDYYINLLESRARGGVGLIVTGETVVSEDQRMISLAFYSRRMVPGFARLTEAIKCHGTRIFLQIAHPGGVSLTTMTGRQPVAPTAMKSPRYTDLPRALTTDEVRDLVEHYVQTAYWAMEAGFDGVEMHAAHGFDLIGQFLSPSTNQRRDEYGGTFEGRMKFAEEIVRGIKRLCGPNFPVGLKYNGYEAVEDGIRLPLAKRIGQYMERVGVDYLHVASMTYGLDGYEFPSLSPLYSKSGALIELAREIKKNLKSIPVVGTGGINSPEHAERILDTREVDLLALGRALFADPRWVAKIRRTQVPAVRPCIRCNVCHQRLFRNQLIKCTVNPFLTWEGEQESVKQARDIKSVAVVGGGPAGIQAALVASQRGHRVTLYERNARLGGNLIPGSVPDFKADLRMLLDYYTEAVSKSDIEVKSGVEASPNMIVAGGFDAVILALGAEHLIPEVNGIKSASVLTATEAYDPEHRQDIGDQLVILGAGHVGCELAWHMRLLRKSVTLVDIVAVDDILADEHHTNRVTLLRNLEIQGVQILGERTLREVGEGTVVFEYRNGKLESYRVDNLIVAVGFRSRKGFGEALSHHMPDRELYEIGDCATPGRLFEAIHSGKTIAEKM